MAYESLITWLESKGFDFDDEISTDENVARLMDTLKRSAKSRQQFDNFDLIDTMQFRRAVSYKLRIEERRKEGLTLDWEDIKPSKFARSIKQGNVTKSFQEFYALNPNEAQEVVFRLQSQGIASGDIK